MQGICHEVQILEQSYCERPSKDQLIAGVIHLKLILFIFAIAHKIMNLIILLIL